MRVPKTALGEAVLEQAALRKAGVAGIRSRVVAAVAMGTLARSRVYRTWTAPELTVSTRDGSAVELSADGEVVTGDPAVTLRKRRDPLQVYRPEVPKVYDGAPDRMRHCYP